MSDALHARIGHLAAMPARWRARWGWLAAWAGVSAVTCWLARAAGPAPLDPDEYASAYYFDRLVHGRRLDEVLLTTPKPLLSLVHGLAWELGRDWRAGVVLTGMALALAVVALARVAARLGGIPAAGAVALVLLGSVPLAIETVHGNSVVWALAGWALAADALTARAPVKCRCRASTTCSDGEPQRRAPRALERCSEPRRWATGGAALLLAALARSEGWLLLPLAAALGIMAAVRGERRALWLLLPLAAPLLWVAHDWLLTGNPLWSLRVPELYTSAPDPDTLQMRPRVVVPPLEWLRMVGDRYLGDLALAAAALVGAWCLAWRRAWAPLAGLTALFAGVLVVFGVYSARGVFFTPRYFEIPDTVERMAAALGVAAVAAAAAGLALRRVPRVPRLAATSVVALALVAWLLWPLAPLDRPLAAKLAGERRASANAAAAVAALRPLAAEPGTVLLVSRWQRSRIALELGLPLERVRDLTTIGFGPDLERGIAGATAVYYDAATDPLRFAPLARTAPGRLGALTLTPLRTDPGRGLYVLAVRPSP